MPCTHERKVVDGSPCPKCTADRQRAYRRKGIEARRILEELSNAGIDPTTILNKADKISTAVKILELLDVDPVRASFIFRNNPDLYRRALEMVEKLQGLKQKVGA